MKKRTRSVTELDGKIIPTAEFATLCGFASCEEMEAADATKERAELADAVLRLREARQRRRAARDSEWLTFVQGLY